jgi:hypothetical protein
LTPQHLPQRTLTINGHIVPSDDQLISGCMSKMILDTEYQHW